MSQSFIGIETRRDEDGIHIAVSHLCCWECGKDNPRQWLVGKLDQVFRGCETYQAAEHWMQRSGCVLPVACLIPTNLQGSQN